VAYGGALGDLLWPNNYVCADLSVHTIIWAQLWSPFGAFGPPYSVRRVLYFDLLLGTQKAD